jgi:hypothetical protein
MSISGLKKVVSFFSDFFWTGNRFYFVDINMAQQNINFDKLWTKGLLWGPPQSFVVAL